ncbi:histidine phosphatase family protein [Actinomadura fibrosa]|uniref:Histidine phosphatase family protein n=1 Tax=Actinomadura fibrosa TaxID=111802 RepID=A0ABW2XP52_9ACTN|nr:histidine phosphatase family protein [Actinomadura fibrosa]
MSDTQNPGSGGAPAPLPVDSPVEASYDAGAETGAVWLVRHGESESNAGLPTNGPGAAPLTARGRAEADRVAASFPRPPGLVVSSPFVRARETAAPTLARFPGVPYEEWPVQEFTYLGDLHGPRTTNAERRPFAEAYWDRADPALVLGGDGESFAGLLDRVRAFTSRLEDGLAGRHAGELIAVFTHGIFMRALMWSLFTGVERPGPADMRAFRRFADACTMPNGGIVELRPPRPGTGRRGLVVIGGATAHLAPAPAPALAPAPQPGKLAK